MILAVCAILLSIIATPVWPWFHAYLMGHLDHLKISWAISSDVLLVMLFSTCVVAAGISLAWWLYALKPVAKEEPADPLEKVQPDIFSLLRDKFLIDEFYELTVVRLNAFLAGFSDWMDRVMWGGLVWVVSSLVVWVSWLNRLIDDLLINSGFNMGCGSFRLSARILSHFQNGQVQRYLRVVGLALAVLALIFIWGCK